MRSNIPGIKVRKKNPSSTAHGLRSKINNPRSISIIKGVLLTLIILIIGINFHFLFVSQNPYAVAKKLIYSLSAGDRYFGRLSLWYLYVKDNRLADAAKLEPKLDPVDTIVFKIQYFPPEIKKRLNELSVKKDKTTEDLMEIAILQAKLNKHQDALTSVSRAHDLDPIRSDIEKLYYELSK